MEERTLSRMLIITFGMGHFRGVSNFSVEVSKFKAERPGPRLDRGSVEGGGRVMRGGLQLSAQKSREVFGLLCPDGTCPHALHSALGCRLVISSMYGMEGGADNSKVRRVDTSS